MFNPEIQASCVMESRGTLPVVKRCPAISGEANGKSRSSLGGPT